MRRRLGLGFWLVIYEIRGLIIFVSLSVVFNYWTITFLIWIRFSSGFLLVRVSALRFNLVADSWSVSFFLLLLVVSSRVFR